MQVQGQTVPAASIRESVEKMMSAYDIIRNDFVDIDYGEFDDGYHFHIFPRVPDHDKFLPNGQAFCAAVERVVRAIAGANADVEAEFHEREGVEVRTTETGETVQTPADTRVYTYFRDDSGKLTSIKYPYAVEKLWFVIRKVKGSIYDNNFRHRVARAVADEAQTLATSS